MGRIAGLVFCLLLTSTPAAVAEHTERLIRIGVDKETPLDAVRRVEDAARKGKLRMKLVWVQSTDPALRSGEIDVSLAETVTDERRLVYHQTRPWRDGEAVAARFGFEGVAEEIRKDLAGDYTDVRLPFVAVAGLLGLAIFWRRTRQAEHTAEEALLFKARFLANLSHELRTPMNAIIGLTHLLLETRLEADQRDSIEAIRTSAADLQNVIGNLLDLSALRRQSVAIAPSRFDLVQLVEDVAWMMRPAAVAKGLEFGLTVRSNVPRVVDADSSRLRQALIHLIANAIKFTQRGYVVVEVTHEGSTLRFEVRDSGPGIPAQLRPHLFEEFSMADATSTRSMRGLGLGLALSRQWVEAMGGKIGVESTPGEGSVFWFSIAPVVAQKRAEMPALSGKRALLIDDGSLSAIGLGENLARLGAEVASIGSAPLALTLMRNAAVEGQPFSFVFVRDGQTLDREVFERSTRASDHHPIVLPLADTRLSDLEAVLTGPARAELDETRADLRQSLAALLTATSRLATPAQPSANGVPATAPIQAPIQAKTS
jgi:signal transduction histidine kinase